MERQATGIDTFKYRIGAWWGCMVRYWTSGNRLLEYAERATPCSPLTAPQSPFVTSCPRGDLHGIRHRGESRYLGVSILGRQVSTPSYGRVGVQKANGL